MRLLVVGDLHLHARSDGTVSRDLQALVDRYAAHGPLRLVLSGDVYDLAVAGSGPLGDRLAAIDARHGCLHDALGRVVRSGGQVLLIPGNHDGEMLSDQGRAFFERRVPGARVSPWFYREGNLVHVEHGNQYDPDNAQPHPLVASGDPLGVLLTRRILHRLGDLRLLVLNDRTPLPMLAACFASYGLRTPAMVARYMSLGVRLTIRGPNGIARAREEGRRRLLELSVQRDLPLQQLEALAALSVRPTLESRSALFRRMYMDRLLGSLGVGICAVAIAAGAMPVASGAMLATAVASVAALAVLSPNRYRGRAAQGLRDAAHRIAELCGVRYVVMGHAHEPTDDGPYLNTGAFGVMRRGLERSFVEIASGVARHRRMAPGGPPPEPLLDERQCR